MSEVTARQWTPGEIAEMRSLWPHQSFAQIANQFQTTRGAIAGLFSRNNFPRLTSEDRKMRPKVRRVGRWTSDQIEQMRALWPFCTSSEIAARFGTTKNAVIGISGRYDFPAKREKLSPEERAERKRKSDAKRRARRGITPRFSRRHPRREIVYAAPDPATACGLMELTPSTCRWPVGEAVGAAQFFCGGPAEASSYCGYHRHLAYNYRPRV